MLSRELRSAYHGGYDCLRPSRQTVDEHKNQLAYGYGGEHQGRPDDHAAPASSSEPVIHGACAGYGAYGGWGAQRDPGIRPEYQAAANYIHVGHFAEALQALSGVPLAERDANWYAISAMANSGAGNRVQALADARRAAAMDPANPDIQRLLHQIESGGDAYATYSAGYPNSGFGTGSWCADMCLLNLCCNPCFSPCC